MGQQQVIYQQVPQQKAQQGYPAQQQQQQIFTQGYKPPGPNVVIVPQQQQQKIQFAPSISSRSPQQALCPRCQGLRTTRTTPVAGLGTWVVAGGICLFGCWAGCCLIPFCVDDMKDIEHRCSQCGSFLGTKKFM